MVNNLAESIRQTPNKRHLAARRFLEIDFSRIVSHFTLSWQLWRRKQFIRAPLRLITLLDCETWSFTPIISLPAESIFGTKLEKFISDVTNCHHVGII